MAEDQHLLLEGLSTSASRPPAPTRACRSPWLLGSGPGLPILVLSQHVEQLYARQLLTGGGGVGYLLKDRVLNAGQFVDAVHRVASGGTVMDPEVINQLLARNTHNGPLNRLTARERDVLTLMAEGRSNAAIAHQLHLSDSAVSKHTTSIFAKLDLASNDDDNRRVLAVLAFLDGQGDP